MVRRKPATCAVPASVAAPGDAVDLANEGAFDHFMEWMSLYIPTWGTSVTVHAAILLLAAFVAWRVPPPETICTVPGDVRMESKPNVVKRYPRETQKTESRGRMKPQESGFVRQVTSNPLQDFASNRMEPLQVIGVGSRGREVGSFEEGLGKGTGFYNIVLPSEAETAHKIVYVVDRSGSMSDSMYLVKEELKRSIGALPENYEFHVIFYSAGPAVEMPTRRLVAATERNKQLAFDFIDGIVSQGGTDPSQAIDRALAVRPELVFLLTDGEFDRGVINLVSRRNAGVGASICTIGFLYTRPGTDGESVLKVIAGQNGGTYKFVSEQDLADWSR